MYSEKYQVARTISRKYFSNCRTRSTQKQILSNFAFITRRPIRPPNTRFRLPKLSIFQLFPVRFCHFFKLGSFCESLTHDRFAFLKISLNLIVSMHNSPFYTFLFMVAVPKTPWNGQNGRPKSAEGKKTGNRAATISRTRFSRPNKKIFFKPPD